MKRRLVPVNIITGFLGAGKTSAIVHLLAQRPREEYWAVIVNEFGAVGIDGALIGGNPGSRDGVAVVEIPGGCMCCTAGPQLPVALNRLLARQRPDRLLIEASGLGHPVEVVEMLGGPQYQSVLALERIATLVDARRLNDERVIGHSIFRQQLAIADVIVGNKQDLYGESDATDLRAWAGQHGANDVQIYFTTYGRVDAQWLSGRTACVPGPDARIGNAGDGAFAEAPIPACGYLAAMNEGEGFASAGWRFDPSWIFSRRRLLGFLRGLSVTRVKGVFVTDEGVYAYNHAGDAVMEVELDDCLESRIEIIADAAEPGWRDALFACVQPDPVLSV